MATIKVQLVNTGNDDVKVGAHITEQTAKAGTTTDGTVDDQSAEAYGFLAQGVALVPDGVSKTALAKALPSASKRSRKNDTD